MPITLITGTPGAGKTLAALEYVLVEELGIKDAPQLSVDELKTAIRERAKRPLIVVGVEGLSPGLFTEAETPFNWQDFEDGTVFLVDEAWNWFGSHDQARKADPRVLELAKHRHRGFDFVMTCQMPGQLLAFLRGLVGRHIHVTRKFGTSVTMRYTWPHLVEDPNGGGQKSNAIEEVWTHPAWVFPLYQSATMHTVRRQIPWKLWAMVPLAFVFLGGIAAALYAVNKLRTAEPAAVSASAGAAEGTGTRRNASRSESTWRTPEEFAQAHTPVIPGIPWSAPVFAGRRVTANPELYCVISGDLAQPGTSCRCYTEQATPLDAPDQVCRAAAIAGVYNPYRATRRESVQESPGSERRAPARPSAPSVNGQPADPRIGSAYRPWEPQTGYRPAF